MEDANVVCRALGLPDAIAATREATFGRGEGRIWLNSVECVGDEDSLDDCDYSDYQPINCNHGEDAGVVCGEPSGTLLKIVKYIKALYPSFNSLLLFLVSKERFVFQLLSGDTFL